MKTNRLTVLAFDIRTAHEAAQAGAAAVAERAIAAGHALIEAKSLVKHGKWQSWLRDNCGLSDRSSQRYMQVARSGMKSATVADLGIRAAAEAIATTREPPSSAPSDDPGLAEGAAEWWAYLIKWTWLSPAARQRHRLKVADALANLPKEFHPFVSLWIRDTRDLEESLAEDGPIISMREISDDGLIELTRKALLDVNALERHVTAS